MTTDQILLLDGTYNEEQKRIIQKVLRKIKPLSKYSIEKRIPIEVLEKTIHVITNKYGIQPQWITSMHADGLSGEYGHYSCGVKTSDTHEWLGTVIGLSVYELFAKLTIFMYAYSKGWRSQWRGVDDENK